MTRARLAPSAYLMVVSRSLAAARDCSTPATLAHVTRRTKAAMTLAKMIDRSGRATHAFRQTRRANRAELSRRARFGELAVEFGRDAHSDRSLRASCHTRRQPRRQRQPRPATLGQLDVLRTNLAIHRDGCPEASGKRRITAGKPGRRDADHLLRVSIQVDDLPNRVWRAAELLAPEAVGDDDDRVRTNGGVVCPLEESAQSGLYAQNLEVVAAHDFPADCPGVFSDPKTHRRVLMRGNARERTASFRKVQECRMRDLRTIGGIDDTNDMLAVGNRERPTKHGIRELKDRDVRTDAECEQDER